MMMLLGLFGHPVAHSFSPEMHTAALRATGLDRKFAYIPFDIASDNLGVALQALKVFKARGVNVTIPYKEAVIPFLDELDSQARLIGAVNVIVNQGGRLVGFNTDATGFLRSLLAKSGIEPRDKKALVLGAGGASRAVSAALVLAGVREVAVANRDVGRAMAISGMVESMGVAARTLNLSYRDLAAVRDAHIIVNTTPLGMTGAPPFPLELLASYLGPGQLVCDIVYNPWETGLLQEAKARGCYTLAGGGMLLYQGVEAFQIWTGREAPVEVMREVLEDKLRQL